MIFINCIENNNIEKELLYITKILKKILEQNESNNKDFYNYFDNLIKNKNINITFNENLIATLFKNYLKEYVDNAIVEYGKNNFDNLILNYNIIDIEIDIENKINIVKEYIINDIFKEIYKNNNNIIMRKCFHRMNKQTMKN